MEEQFDIFLDLVNLILRRCIPSFSDITLFEMLF